MQKIDVLYKLLGLLLKVHRETKNEDVDKACAMVGYLIDSHWEKSTKKRYKQCFKEWRRTK